MHDKVLMIDEIKCSGTYTGDIDSPASLDAWVNGPVVEFSNITPILRDQYVHKDGSVNVGDCLNVRPPFHTTWSESLSYFASRNRTNEISRVGSAIGCYERGMFMDAVNLSGDNHRTSFLKEMLTQYEHIEGAHVLILKLFFTVSKECIYAGTTFGVISPEGKMLSNIHIIDMPQWATARDMPITVGSSIVTLLALQFMNCKNVSLQENTPSAKFCKARLKRHGVEPVRYHTIHLDPFGAPKNEGVSTGTGFKKALHICRGHFSTYTEEKPLFGKYSGTYWIPAHVKGDRALGEIKSRYDFKPVA